MLTEIFSHWKAAVSGSQRETWCFSPMTSKAVKICQWWLWWLIIRCLTVNLSTRHTAVRPVTSLAFDALQLPVSSNQTGTAIKKRRRNYHPGFPNTPKEELSSTERELITLCSCEGCRRGSSSLICTWESGGVAVTAGTASPRQSASFGGLLTTAPPAGPWGVDVRVLAFVPMTTTDTMTDRLMVRRRKQVCCCAAMICRSLVENEVSHVPPRGTTHDMNWKWNTWNLKRAMGTQEAQTVSYLPLCLTFHHTNGKMKKIYITHGSFVMSQRAPIA